jgi:hypothetical protein
VHRSPSFRRRGLALAVGAIPSGLGQTVGPETLRFSYLSFLLCRVASRCDTCAAMFTRQSFIAQMSDQLHAFPPCALVVLTLVTLLHTGPSSRVVCLGASVRTAYYTYARHFPVTCRLNVRSSRAPHRS